MLSGAEPGLPAAGERRSSPRPAKIEIPCQNPRCITSAEPALSPAFYLQDAETRCWCAYCESGVTL
ncbi:MAG: hypothetical protein FWE77_03030 [Clostridia bacterium]|nr:hypothetical protein [Clostridia bacterium]